MSSNANTRVMEHAIELADELGGEFPHEVGAIVTSFSVDFDELLAYIAYMQCILRYRREPA